MSEHRPCPSCPDGNVWNSNGPTGAVCPTCNGHAVLHINGMPIGPRPGKRPTVWHETEDERLDNPQHGQARDINRKPY